MEAGGLGKPSGGRGRRGRGFARPRRGVAESFDMLHEPGPRKSIHMQQSWDKRRNKKTSELNTLYLKPPSGPVVSRRTTRRPQS